MPTSAYVVSLPGFDWAVLFTLLLVLCVSLTVFIWQIRRWTTHRGWRELLDFSRERGLTLSRPDKPAAEPFDRLAGAKIATSLESDDVRAQQLHLMTTDGSEPARFHVVVRKLARSWPATALRPVNAPSSLIDHFNLSAYPRMGDTDRFVIFASDTATARLLSRSEARALLPPDVGLLLHGQFLVLDFSTRPFDNIELGRMIALAEQLVQHLPMA